ncbi:MAG: hypothetical protein Q8O74_09975, partial [bacterium]|nr:hypothetical protein [bacterium]
MPALNKRSISLQLNAAQVAISNALTDSETLKMLSEYGYTSARIKEGQKLYEAARLAVNRHKSLSGEQQETTSQLNKTRILAADAYQALAKVARAVWIRDKARLEALGLHGKMPRSTGGFLNAAYTLFDNAGNNPGSNAVLADYGYTKPRLASERAKIAEYDKLNQAQEAAKGEAQNAVREQDAALKELNEWLTRF